MGTREVADELTVRVQCVKNLRGAALSHRLIIRLLSVKGKLAACD